MESTLLCIQILLFHPHFSYLNTPWSQYVRISDLPLYVHALMHKSNTDTNLGRLGVDFDFS